MPYTSDKTRIILSFANAGGGDLFVHWLRDRLMKDLDYYSENAVFLDNVASRNGGEVKPDLRGKPDNYFNPTTGETADGKYVSIGAVNDNWLKMWETALSQAKVLIQIQTPEYFTSDACVKEMAKIREKLGKFGNKLEVLAITLDGSMARVIIGQPRTTAMKLSKVPGKTARDSPIYLLKDSWVIGESDFTRVSDFVKANGCRVGA
ncbi:MAG TPA: hypothetical protein VMU81_03115 [Acetobacteraceae bacterium]|nr:hypothetical protein [Acetobacteraceae bacterium]